MDISTMMCDPTLPLTMHEYDEWGNPSTDQTVRGYLESYSPCDNILGFPPQASCNKASHYRYPHMYVTTSTNDTRVGYWEPAKWVSRLGAVRQRAIESGSDKEAARRMLLLRTDDNAGHFGTSFEGVAEEYAFLYRALGLHPDGQPGQQHTVQL